MSETRDLIAEARRTADNYDEDMREGGTILRQLADRLESAEAQRDAAVARTEALEKLLACYRVGKQPSEKLHRELDRTRRALAALAGTDET